MTSFPVFQVAAAALCSAALYVILKFFQRWQVNNLQGLTVNYMTASLLSFFISFDANKNLLISSGNLFLPAILIGLLFILVFMITAMTAQKSGLAIASIASKMSMAIPIMAGVLLFGDNMNAIRITGIVLALVAVFFSGSAAPGKQDAEQKKNYLLPVLLFIGSGMVDTSIKISEHYFIDEHNINFYFSLLFGSAGCIGIIMLVIRYFRKKELVTFKAIKAGILLGSVNYFSLIFLVNALASDGAESSIIFAVVNMLVVMLSTIFGILIFLEKPTRLNIAGLALALTALLILAY